MSKGTSGTSDDLDAVRVIVDALGAFQTADRQRILRWAQEKLGLPGFIGAPSTAQQAESAIKHQPESAAVGGVTDIRTFIEKKKPASDLQFTAAVAYYYRFEAPSDQRKDGITSSDLLDACRQVGRPRMKRPAQTLVNAHRQGLLDRGEPGTYSLSTVGENLVAVALPADGGPPRARRPANRNPQRKKPAGKTTPRARRPRR
jgi:hypothetical protein